MDTAELKTLRDRVAKLTGPDRDVDERVTLRRLLAVALDAMGWMHRDMILRADEEDGEKIVPCGATAWRKLDEALATIRAETSPLQQPEKD